MFCLAGYLGFAGSSRGASEENVFGVHFELVGPGQSSKTSSLVAVCPRCLKCTWSPWNISSELLEIQVSKGFQRSGFRK